ncbi:hypothetical protein KIL84_021614 [Mauremys mutica]|uniref:Uncharacterized protein n=1 Tax=Mauremys mutica TaxID=74926 RepID=A0A9D4B039_9SAUR|nr:hypothetical protein KIL84_021614 [Mauremys mutica]
MILTGRGNGTKRGTSCQELNGAEVNAFPLITACPRFLLSSAAILLEREVLLLTGAVGILL